MTPTSLEASVSLCPQVAACQWLGTPAMTSSLLEKMPDAMRKDVEKAVADNPGKPIPLRFTRKEVNN